MFLVDLYNNKRLFENISPIDLAEMLFNGLMQQYPEAVKRYGHEVVGDAVMNYAEDAEDIHSMSDVDIAIQEILDDLANYLGDRTNELEPDGEAPLQEDLRKWFKEKWVRFGPDGKIRGACARGDDSEGKPKCLPQAKAHALGKKGRKYAAAKKRREDPDPERRGPAKNVATKKKTNEGVAEGSDELYQQAIRKYVQQVANNYLGGGNAHLYGASNFNSEMFGVDPKQAQQDFDALFPQYLKKLQGGGKGLAEGSTSHAELAKLAHDAYVAASRKGNGPMAAYYLKQYLKHKADAAKDKKGVAENKSVIPTEDTLTNVKKLWQFIKRNLYDLTSDASFQYDHYKKPYVDKRLTNLLKTADGAPITIAFDIKSDLQLKNDILYIPIGLMWQYRAVFDASTFTKKVMDLLSGQPAVTENEQSTMQEKTMCPECGGPAFSDLMLAEKQDACYHKVKSRYKVWPSAYASGALVQCRKKGAANWGKKKTNEAKESPTQDYQKMMNFVQAQRLSGVPPEQQVAVALFKELEKTKAFNKELDAELKAAEERLGVSAKQGELTGQELSKHRGELEKEKAAGAKQRVAMGDFEKVSAEREQASNRQLQGLTQKLEQLKAKPGIDPAATAALERQIAELEQKMQDQQGTGVAADKIAELERAIANVQQGETVDADAIQRLEQQFKAAETAAQTAKEKVGQVKDYESQIAKLNAEIDNLTKELKQDSGQITALNAAVADVVKPTLSAHNDELKQLDAESGNYEERIQELEMQIRNLLKFVTPSTAQTKPAYSITPANTTQFGQATETRFYFTAKATLAETLRTDFAMTQDSEGWYLTAAQGPAKLLEAQRAFGIPKVKQVKLKEVRISDYTGRAGTIGDENATSPIGSLPRQGRRPA